jgi:cold shock CspA family protein
MAIGHIKTVNNDSHGWIVCEDKRLDLFWHIKYCSFGFIPRIGKRVEFEIAHDSISSVRGHAVNVRAADNDDDADLAATDVDAEQRSGGE